MAKKHHLLGIISGFQAYLLSQEHVFLGGQVIVVIEPPGQEVVSEHHMIIIIEKHPFSLKYGFCN